MLKKLLAILLNICVLLNLVTAVIATAEQELIWLEVEEGSFSEGWVGLVPATATLGGTPSGTGYLGMSTTNGPLTIDMGFNVPENTDYDVWILSAPPAETTSISALQWMIDGIGSSDTGYMTYESTGETVTQVWQSNRVNTGTPWHSWRRFAKNTFLTAGDHTFNVKYSGLLGNANVHRGDIDCIALIPSSWELNEMPSDSPAHLYKPVKPLPPVPPLTNYAWIEAETPDLINPFDVVDATNPANSASGGALLVKSAPNTDPYTTVVYNFELSENDDYDIWYLGTGTGSLFEHMSMVFWDLDNTLPPVAPENDSPLRLSVNQDTNPTIVSAALGGSWIPLFWQKMASSKAISAGNHTLSLGYKPRASDSRIIFAADCMVVVPTSWGWTPPTAGVTDLHPNFEATKLDNISLNKGHFSQLSLNGIKNDLILPTAKGQAGSTFTFISGNTAITNDGIVSRPTFLDGDTTGIFTSVATKGTQTNQNVYTVTVLKSPKYTIKEFDIVNSSNNQVITLNAGETVTAKVSLERNIPGFGNATLIIALYDNNDTLCDIDFHQDLEVDSDGADLSIGLTLPGTGGGVLTGYKIKAFLWDDWNIMTPLEFPLNVPR